MTESILEEAQRLIHGPRNKNYGHPRENFDDIAALFSGYLGQTISDIDVANLMILVKIARVKGTGYHRDSFTDIAGYAGCVERIYEEDAEEFVKEKIDQWVEFDASETRVWQSIEDVPVGVVVSDKDGDLFRWNRTTGATEYKVNRETWVEWPWDTPNDLAPFTEVLEAG